MSRPPAIWQQGGNRDAAGPSGSRTEHQDYLEAFRMVHVPLRAAKWVLPKRGAAERSRAND